MRSRVIKTVSSMRRSRFAYSSTLSAASRSRVWARGRLPSDVFTFDYSVFFAIEQRIIPIGFARTFFDKVGMFDHIMVKVI